MALLGEPYLLATYATPSQDTSTKLPNVSHKPILRSVHATCATGAHGKDFATLSIEGDGIHILQLTTMYTIFSQTLGPSVFFAAPAVTRFLSPETSTLYAAIHSDGAKKLDPGRNVWIWKENIYKHSEDRPEPKKSVFFPRPIKRLWAHPAVPFHLIAVSTSGDIMTMSEETHVVSWTMPKKELNLAEAKNNLIRSFAFASKECLFLPHRWKIVTGVAVLCFIQTLKLLRLQVQVVHSMGEVETVMEHNMGQIENIIDISCNLSGVITILSSTGEWKQFNLDIYSLNPTKTLQISALSFDNDKKLMFTQTSILSIEPSFILMAGFEKSSSRDIVLMVWDVVYAVIIAFQKVSLPSTLGLNADSLPALELIPSTSQVLLSVSPSVKVASRGRTTDVSFRSAIFIVPIAMPASSNIALAMGKSLPTEKWLHTPHTTVWEDSGRREVLHAVKISQAKGLPDVADSAFFTWLEAETLRLETVQKSRVAPDEGGVNIGGEGNVPLNLSKKPHITHKSKALKPHLPRQFVSDMMNSVLQPSKHTDIAYSSKIVQYMIKRRAIFYDVVEGGLIPALRRRRDWSSILIALHFVADIPESQTVQLLSDITQQYRSGPNAMVVDSGMPNPIEFLPLLVNYRMSTSAACLALKTCLSDVHDLTYILGILNGWLLRWNEVGSDLVGCTDETMEDGETIALPRLDSIIIFLQILLDAHFLTFLQYPPAIELVRQLSRLLDRQLAAVDDLDRLHGALEAFVRVRTLKTHHHSTTRESAVRRKRKKAQEATELSVGMYQLEELTL